MKNLRTVFFRHECAAQVRYFNPALVVFISARLVLDVTLALPQVHHLCQIFLTIFWFSHVGASLRPGVFFTLKQRDLGFGSEGSRLRLRLRWPITVTICRPLEELTNLVLLNRLTNLFLINFEEVRQ